jgi:hypothetical protein
MVEFANWQELSRAIVKLIRDQYAIDEAKLIRTARLDEDLGLTQEQLESLLDYIEESFVLHFPENTLDEVLQLGELTLLACWLRGFYKQPGFLSEAFVEQCRSLNPGIS